MMKSLVLAFFLVLLLTPSAARPQEPPVGEDVQRMVREGMTEALESRLRGGRTPEEKHLIAQAHANRAARARKIEDRDRYFAEASQKYAAWVDELARKAASRNVNDLVRLGAGRVEFGNMVLSGQLAAGLDEYEIYNGRRGDRERLVSLLQAAQTQYEEADKVLTPLVDDLARYEDELYVSGLYDMLIQAKLDMTLNLGWTHYFLGKLSLKDQEDQRRRHLTVAQRKFQDLIDGGQVGQMRYQCYLALAMAQRELGLLADAERSFGYVFAEDALPVVQAQARYELARCHIASSKFTEARTVLQPLVSKDLGSLSPEDRQSMFYLNLAHVWDAYSYLLEAEYTRGLARTSTAKTAILQQADRLRSTGLSKLRRLGQRGGPWPGLVQIYVTESVDIQTPPKELSVVELLYTAGVLMDAKRYNQARERLVEAAGREGVDAATAGDVLFQLGRCEYLMKNERGAAEAFSSMASTFREHPDAPQAITFAYQLWGKIAERSQDPQDYVRLAGVLRTIVESFADHPEREQAVWLLPVALQMAQRYDEAAAAFAAVPESSRHRDEAQFRATICRRLAVDAARPAQDGEAYQAAARDVAADMLRYADEALARSETAIEQEKLRGWSAQARVSSAELLASRDVRQFEAALRAVEGFERQYPQSDLVGRVLAVRIASLRGLGRLDEAVRILQQYLQTAAPEQVGGTLAGLASGIQEEVERLLSRDDHEGAQDLASKSVETFDALEQWVRADEARAGMLDFVLSGRARMLYLAGRLEEARTVVDSLLARDPRNGNHQHLHALVLTASLAVDAARGELTAAMEAWARLLSDAGIRQRAPERYWEARTNWLSLKLRLGEAADVEQAITQEQIWYPELGGFRFKPRLEALLREARIAQGKSPEPETRPTDGG